MLNGKPTDAMTVLKPTIKDQKVSDGPIPRNPLNSWNNPPTISLLNYPAPKHQPRHISDHPLIFWGGPNSACGVCFSLNKSTSYLSLRLQILSRWSKNLRFTGNTVITMNVEVQTLQIRVKTQLHRPTLQTRGKYLFNVTKKAVMRCVGILWLPPGCPTVALAKRRSALVWQGTVENCTGLNMSLYQCQLKR